MAVGVHRSCAWPLTFQVLTFPLFPRQPLLPSAFCSNDSEFVFLCSLEGQRIPQPSGRSFFSVLLSFCYYARKETEASLVYRVSSRDNQGYTEKPNDDDGDDSDNERAQ